MIFEELLPIENCIDHFFESHPTDQPIIFFGAGFALERILLAFEKKNLTITCICDNDQRKQGTRFRTYEILSLEDSVQRYPDAVYVITAPLYFWEIKDSLEAKLGQEKVCGIDFECGHYFSGKAFKTFFIDNRTRFENLYTLLHDDVSKNTLYNVVKAHFSGQRRDFEAACTGMDDWYLFKSLFAPNADSVYIDCGAFDGDTIQLFNQMAPHGFRAIYAFEPDKDSCRKLQATIEKNNIPNVRIIEKGAYNINGRISFTSSGVYSTVADSNQSVQPNQKRFEVEVTTIDSVLQGNVVDMIKMDIEGAEYQALLGAEDTIKTHKPRLAICLYHNITDFIEIPELITHMVPEYRLFLRHHSESCTDTILYAIPE